MAFNSTFGAFTSARLGIYASQKGLQVTGNNIANINTIGYTRQRLDQRSLKVGAHDRYQTKFDVNVGNGALCTGVSQIRDPYLDIRYRSEMASVGAMEAKLKSLDDLASVLDEVGKNDGDGVVGKLLSALESALRNDSEPGAGYEQYDSLVRSEASKLVNSLKYYANKLEEIRTNTETKFKQDLTEINKILSNIRDLNEDIRLSDIHGDKALEQRDERNLLIDELSKYMKIDVTYSKEKIDQYTEVEKLTITLPGTFDPDENSKNYGKEIKLIDGIYGTQVNVKKGYTKNPDYDPNVKEFVLPDGTETDDGTIPGAKQNPKYFQYVSADGTLTNAASTPNTPNPNYQGHYMAKDGGTTDNYAAAATQPVKNPIWDDPNHPNFKKYTYGFIDKDGNYTTDGGTADAPNRKNPFRQGKFLSADGKSYTDVEAEAKQEPQPNPNYDPKIPKYIDAAGNLTNDPVTYHKKNPDFVGEYLTADGGSTSNLADADYVYDEKYLLELDTLKDKRDKVLRGAKDGGELTDITRLTDTDTSGALQAIREMLTEEGVFASADDLGQNLGKDPDRTAYETLIADPDANKKKGIPYYQKVLDNLAQIFAQTMNEANQIPLDKAAQAYQQGTLTNAGAGGNVTASGFLTADGKSIITKDGKELEPDGGNALTAKDLELPENPTQADIDRVNGYLKQLRANGKLTPEYEFYNGGILFSNHSDSDDPTGITAANLSVAHKWALGEVRILQSVEPEYIDADGNKHEHTTANDNIAHMITLMNQQMNFLAKGYDDPKTQTDSVSDQPFFKGTFQEMFTNISGTLAHDTEINTALYTNYNLNALNLDNDRSSVSGVDLNEEATSIMQFQKSFAAACQLLTTIDSMLDKLINGTL